MKTEPSIEYVHEGRYAAEVNVVLIDTGKGWSPYLSYEDATKLDTVRLALRAATSKLPPPLPASTS